LLALNFHKTFVPERKLLAELLGYAAMGKQGTLKDMSQETGIPMGESSGKMPAIYSYAQGMGLIYSNENKAGDNNVKKPELTALGQSVYVEDKYLGEEITQWLAHINLCRQDIGAQVWHQVFAQGSKTLGASFTKAQLEDYLVKVFGSGNNRTGPLIQTYIEDAALGRAGVISVSNNQIIRQKAPLIKNYALPYTALILELAEVFFSQHTQITTTDFNEKTCLFEVAFWNDRDIEQLLLIVEATGFIAVDRQMQPWIMEIKHGADAVWPKIFDDIA